ncbi:phage holin [Staphylococcus agnetis]|uniref:phage holin n=1 Tax=Staphylococcus agnetis TaxID=985762 RepID=UPI00208EBDB3|nr:phage holin [Staphylococcus agnetis]MCO4341390.1 phage holin [Staphylococcus agnetis]MCO4343377.1 phage holin [Staphylococcus agnetis]MCO4367375.1 phage holin [Staphylococcus agnetis]
MNIKVVARYIVLLLALLNQYLTTKGITPLPVISEEDISSIIMTIMGLYMAYKNNPNTKEAEWANQKMKKYKAEQKYIKATGGMPQKEIVEPVEIEENL